MITNRSLLNLALSLALCALPTTAPAADNGLITKESKYSVTETVTVFTAIDHAAAAKKFGLDMRPRTVIVFGNPKLGTPVGKDAPCTRPIEWFGDIVAQPILGGLHHRYARI